MPLGLIAAALFLCGTIVASALLCYSWRGLETKKKNTHDQRSVCDWCGKKLAWFALIPVIGFFIVRGKCLDCRQAVPYYSLLAEILVGSIWAVTFWHNPDMAVVSLVGFFIISAVLVTIIISDFFWQEIPVPLIWVSLVLVFGLAFLKLIWLPEQLSSLIGALVAAGFFLWQYVLSRGKWVGGGDMWVGALSGALIGWNQVVLVTAVGYAGAAVYAILCALIKRQERLDRVPLGSFLAWSTLIFLLAKLV